MNEVNRLKMIQNVIDRRLTTHLAAERLGISDRQCRRLLQRYREDGPLGMADRRRGKPSNYQLPEGLASSANFMLTLVRRWPARSWPNFTAWYYLKRRCVS